MWSQRKRRGEHSPQPAAVRDRCHNKVSRLLRFTVFRMSFLVLATSVLLSFAPTLGLQSFQIPNFNPTGLKLFGLRHAEAPAQWSHELRIALLAVQRASLLTEAVFQSNFKGTLHKNDASPVTIGDFGAQALIISPLRHNFPEDDIVAEEDAKDLQDNEKLKRVVYEQVENATLVDNLAEKELGGSINSIEAMLDIIDSGGSEGGGTGRIWTIDPIDGTKGFLRVGQHAVCLSLVVDGDVRVGVLGCPNLPISDSKIMAEDLDVNAINIEGRGVLFSAVQGQGATSRPLGRGTLGDTSKIQMRSFSDISDATFCESIEARHSNQGDALRVAEKLGITISAISPWARRKPIQHVQGRTVIGHRIKTEPRTTIVAMMRGGEPMAFGVHAAMPTARFLHAFNPEDVTPAYLRGQATVILVDSVINTGRSIANSIRHIRENAPHVTAVVISGVAHDASLRRRSFICRESSSGTITVISLRLSQNTFQGRHHTDTGNRLFQTTHIE